MGIPFGNVTQRRPDDGYVKLLVCVKCYDEITVDLTTKTTKTTPTVFIQRTGEDTI